MARIRLARARVADIVQDEPLGAETDGERPSKEEEQQAALLLRGQKVPPSRLLLGVRRSSSSSCKNRQQQPPLPPPPPLATPSHAALWLSKWPGLASYSSRVARKRCKKGLPPPALPPVILRQATLQKSRSVESCGGRSGAPSADGGGGLSLSKTPSLPSSLLRTTTAMTTTPHGRGLVSGGDIFYDARGGSILTAAAGSEGGSGGADGGMTSEMLRALAAEVELQMAEEEKAKAAAALKRSGAKGSSTAALDVESDGGEELDEGEEEEEEEEKGDDSVASAPDRASALVLSREPGWHSSLSRPSRKLRQGLPPICETGRRPSMWSLICSLFGKASHDLHSVSVPAHFNEPLTETQRHVEIMQHSHLLDEAAEFPRESPARLLAVFGFACSLVSTCVRTSKPFKDLEGGTFEMVADDDDNEAEEEAEAASEAEAAGKSGSNSAPRRRGRRFRALAEKVQHSPPVVAFCVQGEKWTFEAHDELHVELSLRGLKMHPRGACRLTFIDDGGGGDDKKDAPSTSSSPPPSSSSPSSFSGASSPLLLAQQRPDEYRWNTPAFYVRDIVPSGSPGHMMRVSHKGPFFAKCMATGDAVVAVAAEADPRQARAAASRGLGLMSTVSGRYEPGPGRPAFAAEISGRLDGVVVAKVRREHAEAARRSSTGSRSSLSLGSRACSCAKGQEEEEEEKASPPCSCSLSASSGPSLLGCDPRRFDGGGGRGFSGHAREVLAAWEGGRGGGGGRGEEGGGGGKTPFVLLPLFRGTTAHHRSQRGCGPWGMSPWACSLNDCPPDLLAVLPATDARRRRDVALVERGDGDAADAEKERMEARQRADRAAAARAVGEWKEARLQERRRKRRRDEERAGRAAAPLAGGGGEREEEEERDGDGDGDATAAPSPATTTTSRQQQRPRPFGSPQWFRSVPGTDVWGNPYSRWVYKGGYWESRERREWPEGMRDPYC